MSKVNQYTFTLIFCITLSILLRWFFFEQYGVFANDDHPYIGMAKHIFSGAGPTTDGINPHTIWPPGYPFLIALEELLFLDYFSARIFEYVFLTLLISFLTIALAKSLDITVGTVNILLAFLSPILIYSTATLAVASEIWFTVITLAGTLLVIRFHYASQWYCLLIANFLYSFSYLLRPEGLAYFASSLLAVILWTARNKQTISLKGLIMPVVCFALPVIIFIIPYIVFLFLSTGDLTISGKYAPNSLEAHATYTGSYGLYASNLFGIGRILLAPFFLGPVLLAPIAAFLFALLSRRLRLTAPDLIILAPIPIIFFALLILIPNARALISSIPAFLILAFRGANFFLNEVEFVKKKWVQVVVVMGVLLLQIFSPVALGKLDRHPKLYYKAVDYIIGNEAILPTELINVYSRESTLILYNQKISVCGDIENCSKELDYLLLGNSNHDKLGKKSKFERDEVKGDEVTVGSQKCRRQKDFVRGLFWVSVFKCFRHQP